MTSHLLVLAGTSDSKNTDLYYSPTLTGSGTDALPSEISKGSLHSTYRGQPQILAGMKKPAISSLPGMADKGLRLFVVYFDKRTGENLSLFQCTQIISQFSLR